jgi:hypothetical protein
MNLEFQERMKHHPGVSGIALGGEGIGLADIFTPFLGVLFVIILLLNAAFRKGERNFYYLLVSALVVPVLLYENIFLLLVCPFIYVVVKPKLL